MGISAAVAVHDSSNKISYIRVSSVDGSTAYSNALLTLQFWKDTGVDISTMDFVVENDLSPVISNDGSFILNS